MSYQNAIVLQDLPELTPLNVPIGDTQIVLIREGDELRAFGENVRIQVRRWEKGQSATGN